MVLEAETIKGWKTVKVGDMGNYLNGFPFKPSHWGEEGYPIIRIQNLNNKSKKFNYYAGKVPEKYLIRKNDILISWSASLGVFLWDKDFGWLNQHIFKATPNENIVDRTFFYWTMYSAISGIAEHARGSTMKHVTKLVFDNYEINIPSNISEQKAIAQVLTTVQEAIAGQEELIAKLKELKRGMMQYLFTHGTKGEKTKMTEIGEIPVSWKIIKLKEVCDLQNGYAFKSSDYIDKSETLNVRMSNVKPDGIFDIEYNKRYLPNSYAIKYSNFLLEDGDIVIAMTDMANDPKILGVPTIIKNRAGRNLLLNQRLGKLIDIDTNKIDIAFLKIVLTRENVKIFYKSVAKKGVQINLGKSDILSALIALPEIEEQREIASVIIDIDQKTEHLKEKISVYQSLFKTLLHELMSGERRIK